MPPSPTLRRLMREAAELSPSSPTPSPHFHAAPLSDSNLFEWHFTLVGPPPPSPYAGGLYHGRITLPPTYPLRPPMFRFLTPSGRFEVNREICLSISGFHEETWQPAWGIRLALTALRVFMDEGGSGQVGGLESSEGVRRRLARESRGWRCGVQGCECGGGKGLGEVMEEWWRVCRGKGVEVDEWGEVVGGGEGKREELPEGLSVGYKGERRDGKKGEEEETQRTSGEKTLSRPAEQEEDSSLQPTKTIPFQPSSPDHAPPPPSPPDPQTNPPPQPSANTAQSVLTHPSPARSTTTTPPPPPPTSPSSSSQRPPNQPPASDRPPIHQTSDPSSSQPTAHHHTANTSTPWLDKAISGIIVALIVMVLRRVIARGDFYS
ncbi:MAG: hypothetical protein Q9227_005233 [Pyrenula ochraceoflavens]